VPKIAKDLTRPATHKLYCDSRPVCSKETGFLISILHYKSPKLALDASSVCLRDCMALQLSGPSAHSSAELKRNHSDERNIFVMQATRSRSTLADAPCLSVLPTGRILMATCKLLICNVLHIVSTRVQILFASRSLCVLSAHLQRQEGGEVRVDMQHQTLGVLHALSRSQNLT
jgi:hypothetical protein